MSPLSFLEVFSNITSVVSNESDTIARSLIFLAVIGYFYIQYRFHQASMRKMNVLESGFNAMNMTVHEIKTDHKRVDEKMKEDKDSRIEFRTEILKNQQILTDTVNELNDDFKRHKILLEHKQAILANNQIDKYITTEIQFAHDMVDKFESYLLGMLNDVAMHDTIVTKDILTNKFAEILSRGTTLQFDFYTENEYDGMVINIIRSVNQDVMIVVKKSLDDIINIFIDRYKWNGSLGEIIKAKKESWLYKWERQFREHFTKEVQKVMDI